MMRLTSVDDIVEIHSKSKTRNTGMNRERAHSRLDRAATLDMILSNSIATSGQWPLGIGSGLSQGIKARS